MRIILNYGIDFGFWGVTLNRHASTGRVERAPTATVNRWVSSSTGISYSL
jgi:hypothetical protein